MLQVHDPRPGAGNGRLGDHEGLAVAVVEAHGHLAGELEVLALVVAHRDRVGVVEEDVGRHQARVGEQAGPDRLLALPLVLELGHPAQLADGGGALEQPGEPGVLGHVALDEEGAALGVEADGQQVEGGVEGVGPQVGRVDLRGQGVQVDHAVEGVVVVLEGDPVAEGPEVVAEGEVAGGRDAGEDPAHGAPW